MWKKPILQKTDFEAAKFITMTNEEMEETRGAGSCFIFGAGTSQDGGTGSCFLAGGSWGSEKISCVIMGSW